ncbi:PAS domain-containing protein [Phormidesmis sp. 146-35]
MTIETKPPGLDQTDNSFALPDNEIERLRAVLQISQIAAWEWDISTSRVCWFQNLEVVLGCSIAAVPVNYEAWLQQVHPGDRVRFNLEAIRALITRCDYVSDYRMIRSDAKIQWLRNQGRICFDAENRPMRVLGLTQKIDPPSEICQPSDQKIRFMEAVSHDFRTPLTIIQTATELLERYDESCTKKQERFQQVYQAIEQMTRLLDEALVKE